MSEAPNPYAAPKADSVVQPFGVSGLIDASKGARLANVLIDLVVRTGVALLAGYIVTPPGSSVGAIVGLLMMVGYYVFFEALFGVTPGKLVTRTRVVAVDGRRPTRLQILGRTLSRFVPFEPLSFLGRQPTGWHDRWSSTRVVNRPKHR